MEGLETVDEIRISCFTLAAKFVAPLSKVKTFRVRARAVCLGMFEEAKTKVSMPCHRPEFQATFYGSGL